jgi:hypothetical protein
MGLSVRPPRHSLAACLLAGTCALAILAPAFAEDVVITGVQAVAIEQPHAATLLRRPQGATPADQIIPIHVPQEDILTGEIVEQYAFEAFLDTGTSGVLISQEFADLLGLQNAKAADGVTDVHFFDVTVNGFSEFGVSEPLYVSIGPFPLANEPAYNDLPGINSTFTAPVPVRTQLALTPAGGLLPEPRNVVGMPALAGKTMVVDATSYTHFVDTGDLFQDFPALETSVHAPNDPSIPATGLTVQLSYGNFEASTLIDPPGSVGPTLAHNPFIGRNPLAAPDPANDPPPVVLTRDGAGSGPALSVSGNYLLDTGAQFTFMSSEQALALHVGIRENPTTHAEELYDTDTNQLLPGQFSIDAEGAGQGSVTLVGFNLESLVIPAEEGNLVFTDVPIFILDLELEDALGNTLLLDGDIGMNLFLPSFSLGLDATAAGFDYLVFDEPNHELRLAVVPEPSTGGLTLLAAYGFTLRRRARRRAAAAL